MKESNLWKYLRDGMVGRWDACRHEDCATPGVPDVSYGIDGVQGWIELKSVDAWPTRKDTPLPFRNVNKFQRRWLRERAKAGALCWVFMRVSRSYLLLPESAIEKADVLPARKVDTVCAGYWDDAVDWSEFKELISGVPFPR